MDKGYTDYHQYAQWNDRGIFSINRMKINAQFESLEEIDLPEYSDQEILKDETVIVQYTVDNQKHPIKLGRIAYWDEKNHKLLVFLTNNLELEASTIAAIYNYRWQIELLFKKFKQNFPFKYFRGDNQSAIEIQIWCALIYLLLIEVIRKQLKRNWAFTNMVAITRFHLASYVHLTNFLNNPDKELKGKFPESNQTALF